MNFSWHGVAYPVRFFFLLAISTSTTPTSIAITRRIVEGLCLGMAYDPTHEHDLIRGMHLSAHFTKYSILCTV